MTNLTVSLDEHIIRKARLRAIEEGDVEGAALSMKTHLNRANSNYSTGNSRLRSPPDSAPGANG